MRADRAVTASAPLAGSAGSAGSRTVVRSKISNFMGRTGSRGSARRGPACPARAPCWRHRRRPVCLACPVPPRAPPGPGRWRRRTDRRRVERGLGMHRKHLVPRPRHEFADPGAHPGYAVQGPDGVESGQVGGGSRSPTSDRAMRCRLSWKRARAAAIWRDRSRGSVVAGGEATQDRASLARIGACAAPVAASSSSASRIRGAASPSERLTRSPCAARTRPASGRPDPPRPDAQRVSGGTTPSVSYPGQRPHRDLPLSAAPA